MRDDAAYPAGTEISDQQIKDLEDRYIDRDPDHGGLCYLILPGPRQIPGPDPEPEQAGPDPALIAALAALAVLPGLPELRDRAALDQAAAREHRLTLARGGTRRRACCAGGYRGSGYGKLSEEAILAAAACRIRLGMTWTFLAACSASATPASASPATGPSPSWKNTASPPDPVPPDQHRQAPRPRRCHRNRHHHPRPAAKASKTRRNRRQRHARDPQLIKRQAHSGDFDTQ